MDFSKVQKNREKQRTQRKVLLAATVLFSITMAITFVPWLQKQMTKLGTRASADKILGFLEKGQLKDAYDQCLKPSLMSQHPYKDFEATWRRLLDSKGPIWDKALRGYISKPQGKPYELVTYRLQHERGISMIDFALEPDERGKVLVRAYRIEATNLR